MICVNVFIYCVNVHILQTKNTDRDVEKKKKRTASQIPIGLGKTKVPQCKLQRTIRANIKVVFVS